MKNVIFDLGGVVVDWNPQRLIETYTGDPDLLARLFQKGFFQDYWPEFDRGTLSQDQLVHEMSRYSGRPYAECKDIVEFIKHSLRDIPETQSLIRTLSARGFRLFCLSNMSQEFYDYLKGRDVFRYFEGQIISAREKRIKPEAGIYQLLPERYGLLPEESLFIDDLEKNIAAARQLGFHTVHFTDKEKGIAEICRILGIQVPPVCTQP